MDIEVTMTDKEFLDFTTNRLVLGKLQEVLDKLATLDESVQALQVAVAAVADRVNQLVTPLQQALSDAQTALQAERDQDVRDAADLQAARNATDAALADASAQADNINVQVDALNHIAQPQQ